MWHSRLRGFIEPCPMSCSLGERAAREGGVGGVPAKKETMLYERPGGRKAHNIVRERQHIRESLVRPNGLKELSRKMMVIKLNGKVISSHAMETFGGR